MIEESGVSDPGLGTAGSKIFVGGLDRSVDEGTTRSARGSPFPERSDHPIVGFSLTRWTPSARARVPRPHARPAGRVRPQPPPPRSQSLSRFPPPRRSQPPGVVRNFFSQFGPVVEVLVMRDPHNHQSRGFGFITFQREDSAGIVLQNRYHDMLGKRVEVKSAVPRGQAPPPQRGPALVAGLRLRPAPRRPRPGGAAGGYGYGGGYGNAPGYAAGNDNPWGSNPGFNGGGPGGPGGNQTQGRPGASAGGYGGDKLGGGAGGAGDAAHGWTEHTAPEGYVYYYNARSGVSQWERPMELDFPMSSN